MVREICCHPQCHHLSSEVSKKNYEMHHNNSVSANIIVQPELKYSHLAVPVCYTSWLQARSSIGLNLFFVAFIYLFLLLLLSYLLLSRWNHQYKFNLCTVTAALTGHQSRHRPVWLLFSYNSVQISSLSMRTALMRCCMQWLQLLLVKK